MSDLNTLEGFSNFYRNRNEWAKGGQYRYCCFQKGDKHPKNYGFVLNNQIPVELNLGSIFDGGTGETINYDSLEDMWNDGWRID